MHRTSLFRWRPSAAMVVALVALFAALGGAGWAAVSLPANSVGTSQLRDDAVTYQKIAPHTIGAQRINQSAVQVRVGGFCIGTKGAIGSVGSTGSVTCNSTLPDEYGAAGPAVSVRTGSTTVETKNLPGPSSFLVLADPAVSVMRATSQVTVGCALSVGSTSQFRNITFPPGSATATQLGVIPLQLASGSGTASVVCSTSAGPPTSVVVTSAINSIQTNSNS